MKSINVLRNLIASGNFHHATYRNTGTVWEGLWYFRKDTTVASGSTVVGCVLKTDPDIDAACELVKGAGVNGA